MIYKLIKSTPAPFKKHYIIFKRSCIIHGFKAREILYNRSVIKAKTLNVLKCLGFFVTAAGQFTNHFMNDLKKLAMWNPF
jgi:hypothetical protein